MIREVKRIHRPEDGPAPLAAGEPARPRAGCVEERRSDYFFQNFPPYCACSPSSSSMRNSWLYLATRSLRAGAPVLIWPQLVATARSAIVVSSVSPERCDITDVYADRVARSTVSRVSVSDPIWLTLTRIELAI